MLYLIVVVSSGLEHRYGRFTDMISFSGTMVSLNDVDKIHWRRLRHSWDEMLVIVFCFCHAELDQPMMSSYIDDLIQKCFICFDYFNMQYLVLILDAHVSCGLSGYVIYSDSLFHLVL